MATKLVGMYVSACLQRGLFTLHKIQVIRLKSGFIPYFSGTLGRYVFRLLKLSFKF